MVTLNELMGRTDYGQVKVRKFSTAESLLGVMLRMLLFEQREPLAVSSLFPMLSASLPRFYRGNLSQVEDLAGALHAIYPFLKLQGLIQGYQRCISLTHLPNGEVYIIASNGEGRNWISRDTYPDYLLLHISVSGDYTFEWCVSPLIGKDSVGEAVGYFTRNKPFGGEARIEFDNKDFVELVLNQRKSKLLQGANKPNPTSQDAREAALLLVGQSVKN